MDKLSDSFGAFLGFIIIFSTIYGVYHSYDKHNSGFFAFVFPPYAWYMTIESIGWHDDYADVDWNMRLDHDVSTAILFIAVPEKEVQANIVDFKQSMEKFTARIKQYPKDKLDYIKDASEIYYLLSESAMNDFSNEMINAITERRNVSFSKSDATEAYENSLSKYKGTEQVLQDSDQAYKMLEVMFPEQKLANINDENAQSLIQMLSVVAETERNRKRKIFKDIFGEYPN